MFRGRGMKQPPLPLSCLWEVPGICALFETTPEQGCKAAVGAPWENIPLILPSPGIRPQLMEGPVPKLRH